MIVAFSRAVIIGSAVRTRWAVKPSVYHRLPHVQRTWATRRPSVYHRLVDEIGMVSRDPEFVNLAAQSAVDVATIT